MSTKRCVVLFSGNGSNVENLLNKRDVVEDKLSYISAFTDNAKAKGIEICKKFNLDIGNNIIPPTSKILAIEYIFYIDWAQNT